MAGFLHDFFAARGAGDQRRRAARFRARGRRIWRDDFGRGQHIPGETQTLSLRIYEAVQLGHDATAYRLLIVCVLIAFAAVFSAEWLLRKREAPR